MQTPLDNRRNGRGVRDHHDHAGRDVSGEDLYRWRRGAVVVDPLHLWFPAPPPPENHWMRLVRVTSGMPLNLADNLVFDTGTRVLGVASLSSGNIRHIPVAVVPGPAFPDCPGAARLVVPRRPEDLAFCLSRGEPRQELIRKVTIVLERLSAPMPDDHVAVEIVRLVGAEGTGCFSRSRAGALLAHDHVDLGE